MLLIIVFFVIIAFLLVAYIVLNVELDIDELICKIIFAGIFLMSIGAFMVVTYISVSYTSNIKMHEEIESSQTIVNLKDNRDTKGHFLLEQVMWVQKHTTIITTKLNTAVLKLTKSELISVKYSTQRILPTLIL